MLRTSRTPVREALRRLMGEGLVERASSSACVVGDLSATDIAALYVVRVDLEALSARLAAESQAPDLVERLQHTQQHISEAAESGDLAAGRRAILEFHRICRTASSNFYLERFLGQVEHATRRKMPWISLSERIELWQAVMAEHQTIIDAIAAGDGDAAAKAARDHIAVSSREVIIGRAMQVDTESPPTEDEIWRSMEV